MRDDKKTARMREIEAHAYVLFLEAGFEGTSMLAVAKRARASNETLYRWYGDKNGLFESMVRANADQVRAALTQAIEDGITAIDSLFAVAKALLAMLLSDRAIALNRAAASDSTGALGRILAETGRETVLPLIREVLQSAVRDGILATSKDTDIGTLFVTLLVGDQQIRRVIGALPAPSSGEVARQAEVALERLQTLCPPDGLP